MDSNNAGECVRDPSLKDTLMIHGETIHDEPKLIHYEPFKTIHSGSLKRFKMNQKLFNINLTKRFMMSLKRFTMNLNGSK